MNLLRKMNTILVVFLLMMNTSQVFSKKRDRSIKNSVVKIETKFQNGAREKGAGIVFGYEVNKIYILTAKHVVYRDNRIPENIWVNFYRSGKEHPARLHSNYSDKYDLCVLTVDIPINSIKDYKERYLPPQYTTSKNLPKSRNVIIIGHPGNLNWELINGTLQGIDPPSIRFTGLKEIQPGCSGGALFSLNGKDSLLIGIIQKKGIIQQKKLQSKKDGQALRINFAIDIWEQKFKLSPHGLEYVEKSNKKWLIVGGGILGGIGGYFFFRQKSTPTSPTREGLPYPPELPTFP